MKSRDYQTLAVNRTDELWKQHRTLLLVMATGTGKTIVFSKIIGKRFPKRAMVIAHRQELIWQAKEKIQAVTGLAVDVEMGEYKTHPSLFCKRAPVVVSTVQTHMAGGDGSGRIGKFDPNEFDLLIIDEAHRVMSPSYRRLIDYYMTNEKLVVLGVTATPDRGDEEALGQVFEAVAFEYEILDAIEDGWLVPIDQQFTMIESLDFSAIRTQGGDLNGSDLDAVMRTEKPLYGVASATIETLGDKQGIGFTASVEHAKLLSNICNRPGYGMPRPCAWVCGKTDIDERNQIVSDFKKGKIQFIWNCGVFTEGFDVANVELISVARPTKSRALYAQMVGRGTRPHDSIAHSLNECPNGLLRRMMIDRSPKQSCVVLDFVGNSGKHRLVTTADLLGGKVSDEAIESVINICRKEGRPVRVTKTLEEEEKKIAEQKARVEVDASRKGRLVVKAKFSTKKVDPFDLLSIKPNKPRGWDQNKMLSEPQRGILRSAGFDPDELNYARGSQLVGIIFDRRKNKKATFPQVKKLKDFGYDAANYTFEQANKLMDAIAKNGWKRPEHFEAPEAQPVQTGATAPTNLEDDIPF